MQASNRENAGDETGNTLEGGLAAPLGTGHQSPPGQRSRSLQPPQEFDLTAVQRGAEKTFARWAL